MPKIDDDTYDDDGFGVDVMMLMVMMMCWWWWYGWDDDDDSGVDVLMMVVGLMMVVVGMMMMGPVLHCRTQCGFRPRPPGSSSPLPSLPITGIQRRLMMMMIRRRRRRMVILTSSSLFLCDVKNNSIEKYQMQKYKDWIQYYLPHMRRPSKSHTWVLIGDPTYHWINIFLSNHQHHRT